MTKIRRTYPRENYFWYYTESYSLSKGKNYLRLGIAFMKYYIIDMAVDMDL